MFSVGLATSDIYADWHAKALVIGSATLLIVVTMVAFIVRLNRELAMRRIAEQAAHLSEEAAHRSEATLRILAENSSDMVTRLDLSGRRLYVSPAAEQVMGRPASTLLGGSVMDNILPEDLPVTQSAMERLRAGERAIVAAYRVQRPDGRVIWVEASVRTILNKSTMQPEGAVAVVRDITDRKSLEGKLASLARTDGLTGLANRRAFDDALHREWRLAKREQQPLSLLMLDLDRFKLFNDAYGHLQGDDCLKKVSVAIATAAQRPADLAARFGGEELAVLLPNTSAEGAAVVAEQIREQIQQLRLAHWGNRPFGVVTVSVGVAATCPESDAGDAPEALVKAADEALYTAKGQGRNCVRLAKTCVGSGSAPHLIPAA